MDRLIKLNTKYIEMELLNYYNNQYITICYKKLADDFKRNELPYHYSNIRRVVQNKQFSIKVLDMIIKILNLDVAKILIADK